MNPGFLTPTGVSRNTGLQDIVKRRVLSKSDLRKLRFALVDLTGVEKLGKPQFSGNNETVQGGLGSMSKIACMYAAYQMKFDLEELSRQKGLTTQKDLFDAARKLWSDAQVPDPSKVTQFFAHDPKLEARGKLIVLDGMPIPGLSGLLAAGPRENLHRSSRIAVRLNAPVQGKRPDSGRSRRARLAA